MSAALTAALAARSTVTAEGEAWCEHYAPGAECPACRPIATAPVVLDGDPYTLARWVEATECEDVACHDDHPHLVAVETPTATAPSEPTDEMVEAGVLATYNVRRARHRLKPLTHTNAVVEGLDRDTRDEVRAALTAALAARSSQPATEVEP